jgi:hypothetical protein
LAAAGPPPNRFLALIFMAKAYTKPPLGGAKILNELGEFA